MWSTLRINSWSHFLIYINDLPSIVNKNNNIILYADDTSLINTDVYRDDYSYQVHKMLKSLIIGLTKIL